MISYLLVLVNGLRTAVPVIILLAAAPTFFVLWFPLRLITVLCFSRQVYRRYDDYLYSLYQRLVLFFFENWSQVQIYFHGDHEEIFSRKENVLYLANHQSSVDWIIANMLAVRQGSLGHIRYVLKSDLKRIPLYGFYFEQHGCIYVHRHDKKDLDRVEKGIRQIKSNGLPVWLVIFPEGTRYNPVKNPDAIERSQQFAQKKGVLPFDNLLYPRTGATIAAIHALKDKFDAVYDVTAMYAPTYDNQRRIRLGASSMVEYLQGQTKELHIHIKRIPMNTIPTETDEQISDWLYQRFLTKDKLMKKFYDPNGNPLELEPNRQGVRVQSSLRLTIFATIFFLLTTYVLLVTPQGRSLFWMVCLFGSLIGYLWMHLCPPNKLV